MRAALNIVQSQVGWFALVLSAAAGRPWIGLAVATVLITEAATTFAGAIVDIDQAQRTITFQTSTGQTWTMPVAD